MTTVQSYTNLLDVSTTFDEHADDVDASCPNCFVKRGLTQGVLQAGNETLGENVKLLTKKNNCTTVSTTENADVNRLRTELYSFISNPKVCNTWCTATPKEKPQ